MNAALEPILDEVLARIDAGDVVTETWIRERYAHVAEPLLDVLRVGGMLQSPSVRPLSHVGPLRLLHEVGRGGMGTVYLAEVTRAFRGLGVGERVAAKFLHSDLVDDPRVVKRFLREGAIGRTIRHPNVVPTYAACRFRHQDRVEVALLMEHVEGRTLMAVAKQSDGLWEEFCLFVALEVTRALVAIHAVGVVHRDLKPKNILLDNDHRVRVMDLGVAQVATASNEAGTFAGSLEYAAPEQFDSTSSVDGRADLYALGVTLVAITLGQAPTGTPPYELTGDYSSFFASVVQTLTQPDPNDRFPSAVALAQVLEARERSTWWQSHDLSKRHAEVLPSATPLRGRHAERDRLDRTLESVGRGRGQASLLVAPAGRGKTRLVRDVLQVRTTCVVMATSLADADANRGGLRRAFRSDARVAGLAEGLPPMLRAVFVTWLEGRAVREVSQDILIGAMLQVLRRLSQHAVVVLWIDDLQDGDPSEHALLLGLIRGISQHRIFVVMASRPEVETAWLEAIRVLEHVHVAGLEPLDDTAAREILGDATYPQVLTEDLQRRIVQAAVGHPLFLMTLCRDLLSGRQGVLGRRDDGRWGLPIGHELQVPATINAAILTRVDNLSASEREIIDTAALDGMLLDVGLLAELTGRSHGAVLTLLQQLGQHGWFEVDGRVARFAHPSIRETVIRAMSAARRTQLHTQFAEAALLAGEPVRLCNHAIGAGDRVRVEAAIADALVALEASRRPEAVNRLAASACALGGLSVDVTLLLLNRRQQMLRWMGRYADERDAASEMIALADRMDTVDWRVRGRLSYGGAEHLLDNDEVALRAIREALKIADDAGDESLRLQALLAWGHFEIVRERLTVAMRIGKQALAIAERSGGGVLEVDAREVLARATWFSDPGQSLGYWEDVCRLGYQHELPYVHQRAVGHIAMIHHAQGDIEHAEQMFEECLDLARAHGNRRAVAIVESRLARIQRDRGAYGAALQRLSASISEATEMGNRVEIIGDLDVLAELSLAVGDLSAARRHAERACGAALLPSEVIRTRARLACVEWRSGAHDVSRRMYYASAAQPGDESGPPLEACLSWIEELALAGFRSEALRAAGELSSWLRTAGQEVPALLELWILLLQDRPMMPRAFEWERACDGAPVDVRMRISFLRWCGGADASFLMLAQRDLSILRGGAPVEHTHAIIGLVPIHRCIDRGEALS